MINHEFLEECANIEGLTLSEWLAANDKEWGNE